MIKKTTFLLAVLALNGYANDWPNWRGPNHNGATDAAGLPVKFSKTENIAWKVTMPGPSAATPIISGDRVFVSSTNPKAKELLALCFDRRTGKEIWRRVVGTGYQLDDRSNYASPSPVTDGEVVTFFYGNGDLATFDLEGKKLWAKKIQGEENGFAFQWTFSTSPLLHGGILYLQILQRDTGVRGHGKANGNESYLLALNPKTGKQLWKHNRPSNAKAESLEAFSTPMPFTHNGRKELVIVGGDCLTGHNPKTGEELWRWGTWNPSRIGHWRLVPSPAAGGGVILACAPKGGPVCAVKAGAKGEGQLAWKSAGRTDGVTTDVCSPLFYEGKFFIIYGEGRDKILSCVNPANGKAEWQTNLDSRAKIRTSPTAANGKIYLQNHAGEAFVVDAKKGEILHRTMLGEKGDDLTRASVAIAGGQLFIRTNGALYCVGR
ncbi:MAG: PQQ-binding-like beta-propeller repeat protein [Verrucomicrobia subdivision 3 bacterium]|nr:PQQ-binding-like beta-propeller repeat protein [Limisphaerales bacterium]